MAARGIIIILFLSLIITAICVDEKWTSFIFAQRWPPSTCHYIRCERHRIPPQVTSWTVHGLWPDVGNNCNDSWRFSWDKIKSLEKQLEASWPDLKYNGRSLWQHEWRRHGTCATTLKATNNEFRYFHKVLRLNRLDAFNPQMALEKAGITPSCKKSYPTEDIKHAVQQYFQTNLIMTCTTQRYPETNRTLLMSIYLALSKTFTVTTLHYSNIHQCKPGDKVYIFPVHDIYCSK
ncbi:ribonuclease Oy-like [Haliotis asinina]|uniref:ribonuclease Oy-like n=1 Tax=Haliotis asinina TaxID=109174 RepID=UPI00353241E4